MNDESIAYLWRTVKDIYNILEQKASNRDLVFKQEDVQDLRKTLERMIVKPGKLVSTSSRNKVVHRVAISSEGSASSPPSGSQVPTSVKRARERTEESSSLPESKQPKLSISPPQDCYWREDLRSPTSSTRADTTTSINNAPFAPDEIRTAVLAFKRMLAEQSSSAKVIASVARDLNKPVSQVQDLFDFLQRKHDATAERTPVSPPPQAQSQNSWRITPSHRPSPSFAGSDGGQKGGPRRPAPTLAPQGGDRYTEKESRLIRAAYDRALATGHSLTYAANIVAQKLGRTIQAITMQFTYLRQERERLEEKRRQQDERHRGSFGSEQSSTRGAFPMAQQRPARPMQLHPDVSTVQRKQAKEKEEQRAEKDGSAPAGVKPTQSTDGKEAVQGGPFWLQDLLGQVCSEPGSVVRGQLRDSVCRSLVLQTGMSPATLQDNVKCVLRRKKKKVRAELVGHAGGKRRGKDRWGSEFSGTEDE